MNDVGPVRHAGKLPNMAGEFHSFTRESAWSVGKSLRRVLVAMGIALIAFGLNAASATADCGAPSKRRSACCRRARHHPINNPGAMDVRHSKNSAPAFKEIS